MPGSRKRSRGGKRGLYFSLYSGPRFRKLRELEVLLDRPREVLILTSQTIITQAPIEAEPGNWFPVSA